MEDGGRRAELEGAVVRHSQLSIPDHIERGAQGWRAWTIWRRRHELIASTAPDAVSPSDHAARIAKVRGARILQPATGIWCRPNQQCVHGPFLGDSAAPGHKAS